MDITISLGDLLAIMAFAGQAGMCYALFRRHGSDIGDLRRWKHKEVIPALQDLKLRVGLIEQTGD